MKTKDGSGDSLGDRMKGYEAVFDHRLVRRLPVIVRVDGKAFHTLTRKLDKPFCGKFTSCMHDTAIAMCEQLQGARLAYVQSDEISVLLVDYQTHQTQPWMDYRIQKMTSLAAAVATQAFARSWDVWFGDELSAGRGLFDARVFNLDREEVENYFLWRQRDCVRNSILGTAQAHFSHAALHGLNTDLLQEKLFTEKGINWNDTPTMYKRGVCALKETAPICSLCRVAGPNHQLEATLGACSGCGSPLRAQWVWVADTEIPDFGVDRQYIRQHVFIAQE